MEGDPEKRPGKVQLEVTIQVEGSSSDDEDEGAEGAVLGDPEYDIGGEFVVDENDFGVPDEADGQFGDADEDW